MTKPLLIYGAGGLGREICAMVSALPQWEVTGFIDDQLPVDTKIGNLKVLGGIKYLNSIETLQHVVIAVGDPKAKSKMASQISNKNIAFPSLVHPSAIILNMASTVIGKGTVICAGCVCTTDIIIGDHVLINLKSTIGHDVTIGDFCSVMPGVNVAGRVCVGQRVLIGSGAGVINNILIGDDSRVGMGAVVIKNVLPDTTVAGVPAKEISK